MKNKIFWLIIYVISIGLAIYISKPNNIAPVIKKTFYDSAYQKTIDSLNEFHILYNKLIKQYNKLDSLNKAKRDNKIYYIKKEYEKVDNFNDTTRVLWFDSVFSANQVYK